MSIVAKQRGIRGRREALGPAESTDEGGDDGFNNGASDWDSREGGWINNQQTVEERSSSSNTDTE